MLALLITDTVYQSITDIHTLNYFVYILLNLKDNACRLLVRFDRLNLGCYKHDNKHLGSIKDIHSLDKISDQHFLKKDTA
jgi:hypothetical protein